MNSQVIPISESCRPEKLQFEALYSEEPCPEKKRVWGGGSYTTLEMILSALKQEREWRLGTSKCFIERQLEVQKGGSEQTGFRSGC